MSFKADRPLLNMICMACQSIIIMLPAESRMICMTQHKLIFLHWVCNADILHNIPHGRHKIYNR